MRKYLLVIVAVLVPLMSGCAEKVVIVRDRPAPPPPRVEVVTIAPAPKAVWVPGHWVWRRGAYVWVPGHWRRR